jgi:hypothetical protein
VRYGVSARPSIDGTAGVDHAHAEAGEPFLRVGRCDRGDHAMHVRMHLGEVDLGRRGAQPEAAGIPQVRRMPCGRKQRLGGDAAVVEAIAAHAAFFDQHHRHAE